MVLEADQVVAVGAQVLLAKLKRRRRASGRSWVGQADGLHGAEAKRAAAAARGLFDGETTLEVVDRLGS